ncbi:hypothetical protein HMPREF1141_2131 [Clostridium sp. MSTE9]|nr:hypothetical protein HMPREF1141_2131 [Clostridium sp. MSTE9]
MYCCLEVSVRNVCKAAEKEEGATLFRLFGRYSGRQKTRENVAPWQKSST